MSTTPPEAPKGGARPKVRDDDARGNTAGSREGTEHEGRKGNLPFTPTEAQRERVRTLAKAITEISNEKIAIQLGISRSTLERHFADDLLLGRAELATQAGAQLISLALQGDGAKNDKGKVIAPGNLDALKFLLARRCGWSTKVEMTGKDGRPVETIDLSGMSAAALREYGRQAAIQAGLDPDEAVGPPLDD